MMNATKKTADEEALENLKKWKPNISDTLLLEGQVGMDPGTEGLLTEELARAYEPTELTSQRGLLGTNYEPTSKSGEAARSSALAMDPSAGEALERRVSRKHGDFMGGLRRDVNFKSVTDQADRKASSQKNLMRSEQIRIQNWKQKQLAMDMARALKEHRDAERAGFLGDLLGLFGAGVGALIGSKAK